MPTTRFPGPQIWLQGDPAELEEMMQFGVDGLITNTIILKDLTDQYGQLRGLLQRYLDISDKELVVEVDGDTFDDFMYAAEAAYSMSDRVLIKVPTKKIGIQAHARLRDLGVKTMATTVFSLSQAILAAAAGRQLDRAVRRSYSSVWQRRNCICGRDCGRISKPSQRAGDNRRNRP